MHRRMSILLAATLAAPVAPIAGCERREPTNNRWVTTHNTNVAIDWDRVNQAYREANGPEDLERRINEIYPGNEVISVSVADLDNRTQEVTGFFDRNTSGAVDAGEKIFTIRRELTPEGTARVQTAGYGAYSGYHSPIFSIASGMLMGAMLSRAFSPGYTPMYRQPYVTHPTRLGQIQQGRAGFRAANPGMFRRNPAPNTYGRGTTSPGTYGRGPASGSGRTYGGGRPSGFGRGGGRFGVTRGNRPAPVKLTA